MKTLLFLLAMGVSLAAWGQQPNIAGTVLPSRAYTDTTVNSQTMANTGWKGGHFAINVSAYTSGNYTPHIQGQDPVSGTWYDLLVGSAISSAGITILKIYPGIAALSNGAANDIVPISWRVQLAGASTPSMTLSVGYNFVE